MLNTRLTRILATGLTVIVIVFVIATPALGQLLYESRVTGHTYIRHDGGTDLGIQHCSSAATDPAQDNNPGDTDIDSNDGGNRRQDNEPYSVIDPTNPDVVVAGWNDYCLTDLGAGWEGFGYSLDGGQTWTNSLVPGYPFDTSPEGMASPLYGTHTDAGDPVAGFDNAGNLFVGGIAFNRTKPQNGDVWVATYGTEPHPSGFPYDHLRTVVVGQGTPSSTNGGIFQDKIMLEVDRTGGEHDGNVYVCWTRFTGFGQNKIYFTRSTDSGETFSKPIAISRSNEVKSVQGCDIAVESDGDVYVAFRTYAQNQNFATGLGFARSDDGGESFSNAQLITPIVTYFPYDSGARDCGDGPYLCPSDYVFHRYPLEPRLTSDPTGELEGVYLVYNAVDPDSIVPAETSYWSAGAGVVGQSLVYVTLTLDDGATWSTPQAVDPQPVGHQYFPDIDALEGRLAVVWQDSRTDPSYTVQAPPGNVLDDEGRAVSAELVYGTDNIINTFMSSSTDGETWSGATQVSSEGHQSQYEMFGARNIPFQGDYNWISLARDAAGGLFAYMTWTDNRDVLPGEDPRELEQYNGFNDGFDVLQCLTDLGAANAEQDTNIPLARRDAPWTGNACANNGGLNQNIYGAGYTFP